MVYQKAKHDYAHDLLSMRLTNSSDKPQRNYCICRGYETGLTLTELSDISALRHDHIRMIIAKQLLKERLDNE